MSLKFKPLSIDVYGTIFEPKVVKHNGSNYYLQGVAVGVASKSQSAREAEWRLRQATGRETIIADSSNLKGFCGIYVQSDKESAKRLKKRETSCTNEPIFREIAKEVGLNSVDTERFVKFSCIWKGDGYPNEHYMTEWADRFKRKDEYLCADEDRQNILVEVDGNTAYGIYRKELIRWYGNDSNSVWSRLAVFCKKYGFTDVQLRRTKSVVKRKKMTKKVK